MSFFSESIKEFDHVVWPTKAETIKYFNIVVSMIIVLTVVLFAVGTAFSVGLFSLKSQIAPIAPQTSSSSSTSTSGLDLSNIKVESTTAPAQK